MITNKVSFQLHKVQYLEIQTLHLKTIFRLDFLILQELLFICFLFKIFNWIFGGDIG